MCGGKVLTTVTHGASVDVLVTDHGIAVNPARQDLLDNLRAAGVALMTIEQLQQRAEQLTGKPQPIEFTDRVVAVVRYRDGSVIDVIRGLKADEGAQTCCTRPQLRWRRCYKRAINVPPGSVRR